MHNRIKIGIICIIIPVAIAITVGITFESLGVFNSIDLGSTSQSSINVGALPKRELIVSDVFIYVNQPACRGTITFQHTESGETIVKSYSFGSHSAYMEVVSQRFVVDLKPGEWTINHERTSGDGELEIKSTFSGNQENDRGGLMALGFFAAFMAIAGLVVIKDTMENQKSNEYSRMLGLSGNY